MILYLNKLNITVELSQDRKSACLRSGLPRNNEPVADACLDAIESMILAHAAEGIYVTTDRYQNGVLTALDAIGNNL